MKEENKFEEDFVPGLEEDEAVLFQDEPVEVEEEEVLPEPEEEVKPKRNQNGRKSFKVKVTSIRGIVFADPDFLSKGVTAVGRGNLLKVLSSSNDEKGDEWFEVEVPRSGEPVVGWIQSSRVVRV